jgi:hypothetical protein
MSKAEEEQDSQCRYNVTLRRVYETTVAEERQQVLHISVCVCVCLRACACMWVCVYGCGRVVALV